MNNIENEISPDNIQQSAKQDICTTPNDLARSETTKRIIEYTAKKTSAFIDLNLAANNGIIKIYNNFLNNLPITKKEKNQLLLFFKMDASHKVVQEVISKLFILIGSENGEFVRTFLKDKNGQLTDNNFIQYIINKLENYTCVIDVDGEIEMIDPNHFSYTHQGKFGVLFLENGELFSSYGYLEPVKILDNYMFFGVKENTMKGHIEKIGNSGGTLPYAYDQKLGVMYRFNGSDFEELYKKPGVISVENIGEGYLKYTNEQEKKGVIFIQENTVTEELPAIYEKISYKSGFILTSNKEDENGHFTLGVFKKSNNGMQEILTEDCENDILYSFGFPNEKNEIGNFRHLQGNYYQVETQNGINIYKYFEKENVLELVPGLDWIESISSKEKFFEGSPVVIQFVNNSGGVYTFDSLMGLLKCLIKFNHTQNWLRIKIQGNLLEIYNTLTQQSQYFLYHDNTLFQAKKGYKHGMDKKGGYGYMKKGLFGKKIYLTTKIEEMQEYFSQCDFTINI